MFMGIHCVFLDVDYLGVVTTLGTDGGGYSASGNYIAFTQLSGIAINSAGFVYLMDHQSIYVVTPGGA